jgi:hypothetical protein
VGFQHGNPCTGELVTFTKGTLHIVTPVTEDSGGGFTVIAEFNGAGQGVSDFGTRYVGHVTINAKGEVTTVFERLCRRRLQRVRRDAQALLGDRRLEAQVADLHAGRREVEHPLGFRGYLLALGARKLLERADGQRCAALALALDPPRRPQYPVDEQVADEAAVGEHRAPREVLGDDPPAVGMPEQDIVVLAKEAHRSRDIGTGPRRVG